MITIDLTKEKEGVNINFTGNVIYTKDVGGDKNYATKEYVEEEIKKIEIPNTNNLETKNEAQNKLKEAKSYTDNEIKKVVGNAPESLNTLNKLASATNTNKESIKSLDSAVRNKVDKIDGKGLSTEDFTTVLKQKLESLENFDSSEIEKSVSQLQKQINTLVSGNASTAIESFNEIIAFLEGIEDSEDLSSIIASIEQSIAKKADASSLSKVATSGDYNDLENLPTIPDVSGLASTTEVEEALNSAKSYTDEKFPSIDIPTKTSQLENDSNFAEGMDIITIDEWTDGDNLSVHEEGYLISIYDNQRLIVTAIIDKNIGIMPIMDGTTKTATMEIIFSTIDNVPEILFPDDIMWAKEPAFNSNKTYAITIECNNVDGGISYLAMYAEFDYLNTEE